MNPCTSPARGGRSPRPERARVGSSFPGECRCWGTDPALKPLLDHFTDVSNAVTPAMAGPGFADPAGPFHPSALSSHTVFSDLLTILIGLERPGQLASSPASLPVGCGDGWSTSRQRDAGPHATASQAPVQLRGCRSRPHVHTRQHSPTSSRNFISGSHLPLAGHIPHQRAPIPGNPTAQRGVTPCSITRPPVSPFPCPAHPLERTLAVPVIPAIFAISLVLVSQLRPVPAGHPFSSLGGWHARSQPPHLLSPLFPK